MGQNNVSRGSYEGVYTYNIIYPYTYMHVSLFIHRSILNITRDNGMWGYRVINGDRAKLNLYTDCYLIRTAK